MVARIGRSVTKALFSFGRKKFRDIVALSFVCGNYYLTMD